MTFAAAAAGSCNNGTVHRAGATNFEVIRLKIIAWKMFWVMNINELIKARTAAF